MPTSKPWQDKIVRNLLADSVHHEAHLENAYRSLKALLPNAWPHRPFLDWGPFSVELLDKTRYTWTVKLRYKHPQLPAQLDVRVYLDLKMAEPIAYQGVQINTTIQGQQHDEKRQMLSFLQCWLDTIQTLELDG